MNEPGKSDKPVVPTKFSKMSYWDFHRWYVEGMKASGSSDRPRAGRGLAKENGEIVQDELPPVGPAKQVDRTQSRVREADAGKGEGFPEDLPSALDRVRQAACRDKDLQFTSLWHHVYDIERLREAYLALKRNAAAGVDGQTWQAYGQELESNLQDLSDRLSRGAYRATPVKRVYIPKADGKQRPISIPVLEDKIVQRATVQVLNAVYETDFGWTPSTARLWRPSRPAAGWLPRNAAA